MTGFPYNNKVTVTFLEKIAKFDFDKRYTAKIKILCHLTMWLFFSFFIFLNLFWGYGLNFLSTILFVLRSLVCNAVIFYFFFYFIVPHTLLKNNVALTLISVPFIIPLWLLINHYCFVAIHRTASINVLSIEESVFFGAKQTISQVLNWSYLSAEFMMVVYSVSPFFFTKILFDVARYYSTVFKANQNANQLAIEKLNLETDFLKAQLNPHFLFNTLNNLYGMALKKRDNTPDIIMELSAIMRYTLYESDTDKVLLSKELEFIRNYVSLEKLRYNVKKRIVLDIDDANITFQKIAPLLTFIFIENGFKYGLKSDVNSFLEIKIAVLKNIFYFSITNDKEDAEIDDKENIGGIGIDNVKKRLELLYPGKHHLTITNETNQFSVMLQIEIE